MHFTEHNAWPILYIKEVADVAPNRTFPSLLRCDAHTNTVEGYFSILKRGIYGVCHHASEAHLHRYLAKFDFRYSNRIKLGIDDTERARRVIVGTGGNRLRYQRPPSEARA